MWGSWGSMNKHMLPIILCSTKYKRQEKSRLSIYIKSMCMLLWVLNFFFPPQKNTPSLYISPQQLSFWLIVNWHTISIPVVPICGPWSASDPSSKLFVDTKLTVSLFFTECVLVQSTHVDGLSSLKTVSENGTFYFRFWRTTHIDTLPAVGAEIEFLRALIHLSPFFKNISNLIWAFNSIYVKMETIFSGPYRICIWEPLIYRVYAMQG